ncbi:response regulator transcription factor [Qipengyuania citrea]|jgi:DNA-binding response OmpR family regulator|uniref:Response regulator transcription factor n=1 Tax=Qipengyuania citrea TaxID=225971 RepID=A0ABY4U4Z9_9SPHN|nr:response regulator transcription factor [Qipengyuania citrea]MAG41229.1 DNA-binding response regulator [Erythrobacteraceae bacterium]MCH2497703.1 response regulator transcription factor [Erythrobacter sp.]MAP69702.1 DNA-binding response regulator [Erythrobacteraceae bacterium]PHR05091.1 MAG: DNA-binding response regulator [Erythrobacter sp.]USA60826.1 response regulator transcription factor [Qipengyuania citrea]|tara:strand:+ start:2328 stop:3053 length:726 start_codon:yes stop_codon:yes gene_type:complete
MQISERTYQIALVEDDGALRTLLTRYLRQSGFPVRGYATAAEFRASADQFDLVILDVMLPATSGLDLCRWLRERSKVPIIFISARSSHTDRIVGLELGADDYLIKPVDPGELVARIRSVLRRSEEAGQRDMADYASIVRFEGWQMDRRRRELFAPEGSRVSISEAEFDLLNVFIDMPQRVIGRDTLLEHSRSRLPGRDHSDRSVDVLVSRLRRKLGSVDGGRDLIRTVRGVGYVFTASVDA